MALKDAMLAVAAEKIAPSKKGAVKPPAGKGRKVPAAFLRGRRAPSAEEAGESPAARRSELPPAFLRGKKK